MAWNQNGDPTGGRGGYIPPHLRNGGGAPFMQQQGGYSDRGGFGGGRGGSFRGGGAAGYGGDRRYGGPPPRGGGWGGAGADDRDPFAEDNARKQEWTPCSKPRTRASTSTPTTTFRCALGCSYAPKGIFQSNVAK